MPLYCPPIVRQLYCLNSALHIPRTAIASMQTYDVLMFLVLAAATLFGFWKGMSWQIASLASLVVSYVAALQFSASLRRCLATTRR